MSHFFFGTRTSSFWFVFAVFSASSPGALESLFSLDSLDDMHF